MSASFSSRSRTDSAQLEFDQSGNDAALKTSGNMANLTTTAMTDEAKPPVLDEISAAQRMMSAVSGSIFTSLLVTPLDVVRVRLQSQPNPAQFSALRTSSFNPALAVNNVSNLGVTACCREVFWVSNTAQYCLATSHTAAVNQSGALGALTSPSHVTNISTENCSIEESRRKSFTSTFDGLRKIARNEGITTLWRGLSPTLMMAVPGNVIYFAGYDYLRSSPHSPIYHRVPDNYAPLAAGSIARVAAAIAVSPIEMFRTRMQANSGNSATVFTDTLRGLGEVVQAQGYTSLWRGLTLTMWRDVPFSGFYWWGYEAVRNMLTDVRQSRWTRAGDAGELDGGMHAMRRRSRSRDNMKTTFVDSVIAGATSGAVASLVTTPFDVGKTRQQVFVHSNDIAAAAGAGAASKVKKSAAELLPEERSMPRFLYHILKTEGAAGLFRGWVARCLKVAPACAIMISSYEVGKKMAQKANKRTKDGTATA